MPVRFASSIVHRWLPLPGPAVADSTPFFCVFPQAMNSAMVRAGTDALMNT